MSEYLQIFYLIMQHKQILKNPTRVDKIFAKKIDLASFKSDVNKLDIDNLKNVTTNLSNLHSNEHEIDIDILC